MGAALVLLAGLALFLAALPALLFLANLPLYRSRLPEGEAGVLPPVSVLIPARNEEGAIVAAVEAALASQGVEVEVVVLNDQSEDRTAELVSSLAARDGRVRLVHAPPLPAGWCGKQHACWVLSREAQYPCLLFLDADVRLAPDGLAQLAKFLQASGADLVSGIPRQETGTLLEKLVLPLIHFVLLGFLPMRRMRRSRHPSYAAGCGQLFLTRRQAYDKMGGHAVIRTTLHDGIKLPRAYRAAGLMTDLVDATDLATCRMYNGSGELWRGLAKNATEGLAAPGMIVPATALLVFGQVLPFGLVAAAPWLPTPALALALPALFLAYLPRLAGVVLFRQPLLGAVLHPVGVLVLVAIQWYALGARLVGRPATWKGRAYQAEASP